MAFNSLDFIALLTFFVFSFFQFYPTNPRRYARIAPYIQGAPPSWVFAPVWGVLYCMIAVSGFLLWRQEESAIYWTALGLYGGNLLLNKLWSPVFFGAGKFMAAFLILLGIIGTAIGSTVLMFILNETETYIGGSLMCVYILWCVYAAFLNFQAIPLEDY